MKTNITARIISAVYWALGALLFHTILMAIMYQREAAAVDGRWIFLGCGVAAGLILGWLFASWFTGSLKQAALHAIAFVFLIYVLLFFFNTLYYTFLEVIEKGS